MGEASQNAGRVCSHNHVSNSDQEANCNVQTSFDTCDSYVTNDGRYPCQWEYDFDASLIGLDSRCRITGSEKDMIYFDQNGKTSSTFGIDCVLQESLIPSTCGCEDGTCQILMGDWCTLSDFCQLEGPHSTTTSSNSRLATTTTSSSVSVTFSETTMNTTATSSPRSTTAFDNNTSALSSALSLTPLGMFMMSLA